MYWVNSRSAKNEQTGASFRIAGKAVEIWHPETGAKEPAHYTVENSRTKVSLQHWNDRR
ncbi:glycosyl hydrolase [Agriterribacter sp.]|uniref:glycosyl hydrolase n=1 Tax=Agriterribacter sp. TaxID=2821509 RepID=UPI0039C863A4